MALPAADSVRCASAAQTGRSLHESLIELLPDAVLALDLGTGRFVLANAAAERLLGTTRGQLAHLGLRDLVRPWDVGQAERVATALLTDGHWRGELWLKRQDGTFVPTDVAAQSSNLNGQLLAQLSCRDASDHWREDAMRQVVAHAAEQLAANMDDRETLRTIVTATLPGLADAALVELDAVGDDEPVAVAAVPDPLAPGWQTVAVDELPSQATIDAFRRGNVLSAPLVVRGQCIGTLTLRRASHRRWEPSDHPLIDALAGHAAHAIEQTRQLADARHELAVRASMLRILSAIDTETTTRGVYEILLEEAQIAIQAEDGGGAMWDFDQRLLLPGLPKLGAKTRCVVDPKLMVAVSAAERCALIENDYQRTMGKTTPAGRMGAQAVLAVPMIHQDVMVGSMSISRITSARRFQPSDARRLDRLAAAAATTLAGISRQRTIGARLLARETAHLLGNDLTLTMGSLDLIRESDTLPASLGPLVDTALSGMGQAAHHLAQIQRIRRVETCCGPLGPTLDLARSTDQDAVP